MGTKEVELSTVDASLPFSISMVLRLGTESPGVTFHFEERFEGRGKIGRASRTASDWSSDVCSSDLNYRQWTRACHLAFRWFYALAPSHLGSLFILRSVLRGGIRSEEPRVRQVTGVQTCALPI